MLVCPLGKQQFWGGGRADMEGDPQLVVQVACLGGPQGAPGEGRDCSPPAGGRLSQVHPGSSVPGASSLYRASAAAPEQLFSISTKVRKNGRGLKWR